jgi:hypothetical protein
MRRLVIVASEQEVRTLSPWLRQAYWTHLISSSEYDEIAIVARKSGNFTDALSRNIDARAAGHSFSMI